MTDSNKIYVEGEYAKGKLIRRSFVLDNPADLNPKQVYPSLKQLARDISGHYSNLESEEIQGYGERIELRRPLTIRELEWLAINATRKEGDRKKELVTL